MADEQLKTIDPKTWTEFIAEIPIFKNYRSIQTQCVLFKRKKCPDQLRSEKQCGICVGAIVDQTKMSRVDGFTSSKLPTNLYPTTNTTLLSNLESPMGQLEISHHNDQIEVSFRKQ